MKILYALNGVGNGHAARARELIPEFLRFAHVDVAISGDSPEIALPVEARFRLHGVSFSLGKRGGINYWKTVRELQPLTLLREIREFPIEQYDLVINDFEPVTARAARRAGVRTLTLSHQAAFISKLAPRPKKRDAFCELLFRTYAPCGEHIGFHFSRYDQFIRTPVIRGEVRKLVPRNSGHHTVYLPAYDDAYLAEFLSQIDGTEWHVFSKHSPRSYRQRSVLVLPINNEDYLQSLATCRGLLTGGGFEAPAEALFLGKNLLVVPLRGQYEQHCNAAALQQLGYPVARSLTAATRDIIAGWTRLSIPRKFDFPDETRELVIQIITGEVKPPRTPFASMDMR